MNKYLHLANGSDALIVDAVFISELYDMKKVTPMGEVNLEQGRFYLYYSNKHQLKFYASPVMQLHSPEPEVSDADLVKEFEETILAMQHDASASIAERYTELQDEILKRMASSVMACLKASGITIDPKIEQHPDYQV